MKLGVLILLWLFVSLLVLSDCHPLTGDLEVLMSWSAIKVIGHTYIRTSIDR
jgi:hypothetical protein